MRQSAELGGNAGTTYETQVAAFYMAAVLVEGGALGLERATAKSVAVQRKALGDPLDDIVVVGLRSDGAEAKLQLQAKTSIVVSASNRDFKQIVASSWDAMNDPAFQVGRDRFGGVAQSIAMSKRRDLRRLNDDAALSTDAAEFDAKVAGRGAPSRAVHAEILTALSAAAGRSLTADETWRFFRGFIVLEIRTTGDEAQERSHAIDRLRAGLAIADRSRAPLLFDALESIARRMNRAAGRVEAASLGDLLAGQFEFRPDTAADSVEQLTLRAREAAQADLKGFIAQRDGVFAASVSPSFWNRPDDKDEAQLSLEAYASQLATGKSGLLLGRPGAGKSTALIHIATELLEAYDTVVPILFPLPEYGGNGLIDEVLRRPRFRDVGRKELERLASSGRLVLLCDAWNEVPPTCRDPLKTALSQFTRNHPGSSILVASRAGASYPLSDSTDEVWLSLLSRDQQLALLTELIGEAAEQLLKDASQTEGLSDLIQTPFYLVALTKLMGSGALPSTRDELIAGLMAEYESRVAGRFAFEQALRGVHVSLLRRLGSELVMRATTKLSEPEMRSFISTCSNTLRIEGQIAAALEPSETIGSLVDHHVLVRNQLSNPVTYALPHEQIQEWLASFEVEKAACAIKDVGGRQAFIATYLNDPRWTEAVLFATERLGRAAQATGVAARVVAWALGLSRQFAAQIIERAGDAVWREVSSLVERYIDVWTKSDTPPSESELVAFLTTCGRKELGPALWAVLEGDVAGHALHHVHAGNLFRMLRAEWQPRFAGLAADQRRIILYDLVSWGSPHAVTWAMDAAVKDPVLDVLYGVVNLLEYGRSNVLDDYSAKIAPEMWPQLALRVSTRDLEAGPFGEQLIGEKLSALEGELEAGARRRLLVELAELGVDVDLDELIRLSLDDTERQADLSVTTLATLAPAALSKAVVQRLEAQTRVNARYFEAVLPEDAPSQDRLIELGALPKATYGTQELAGRLLEVTTIVDLLNRVVTMHREETWDEPKRQRYRALGDLISNSRIEVLISALEAFDQLDAPTVEILAERLFRWRQEREHRELVLAPSEGKRISALVAAWAGVALSPTSRYHPVLADLAHTIRLFELHEHLELLANLTRRDSALWQAEQAAFVKAWNGGYPTRDVQSPSTYAMFQQAFEAIEGDRVAEVLISLLDDPLFGVEAAVTLRRFAGVQLPKPGVFAPTYEGYAGRRAHLQTHAGRDPHPIAQLIIDRIEPLLATGDAANFEKAFGFTRALALMDFGNRAKLIERVLRDERLGRRKRLNLLECLKTRGAVLPDDLVLEGLDAAISERLAAKWSSDNDWWEVRQWIVLAAFIESPDAVLPRFQQLPKHLKRPHSFDEFIAALGYVGTERSLEAVQNLLEAIPGAGESSAWARAFQQVGTEDAFNRLTTIIADRARNDEKVGSAAVQSLEVFIQNDEARAVRLLEDQFWREDVRAQSVLGRALTRHISEDIALLLFELSDGQGKGPFAEALIQSAEELGVRRDPIDGTNAYDLTPVRNDRFKQRLATEIYDEQSKSGFAKRLCTRLERGRLYYGRPSDEPRHPAIERRKAWPVWAEFTWADE